MIKVKSRLLAGILLLTTQTINAQISDAEFLNPPKLNDGWATKSTQRAGLDISLLTTLSNKIDSTHYKKIHSVLIIKEGKLVYEKYGEDFGRDSLHRMKSISKFMTSTLLGIAIDNGGIKSKNDGIFDYVPDYQQYKTPEKDKIKLKHLVSMSAGLEWRESDVQYGLPENDETQMYKTDEWLKYVLSKPVIADPGTKFEYSGGLANLTGAIIQNATGMTADMYAKEKLFKPLGIEQFRWNKNKKYGWVSAAAGLYLTPRDLAKVGQMYLNGGTWKGKRILSENWVKETGTSQVGAGQIGPFTLSYGYTVLLIDKGPDFMPSLKGYVSTGNGGQILWIMPEDNAVIVMTGGNYESELSQTQPMDMMIRYIYPALQAAK